MSISEMLVALKARAYEKGAGVVAKEIGVTTDTLRAITSDAPPQWVERMQKIEALVSPAGGAVEPAGEAA